VAAATSTLAVGLGRCCNCCVLHLHSLAIQPSSNSMSLETVVHLVGALWCISKVHDGVN
jgi:hypothetical protein